MSDTVEMETLMIFENLSADELIQHALKNKEGILASNQALVVTTGRRTGRSPKDRFIVKDNYSENAIDWGAVNQPFEPALFQSLWEKAWQHIQTKNHYVSTLQIGSSEQFYIPVKVITEYAWHNLFAKQLFIRERSAAQGISEEWTILDTPNFFASPTHDGTHSEAAILFNLSARKILICGTLYAGEIKKAMFSVMNYLLTEHGVLPMHCAANAGPKGDVALFFGLSGTGKTTLSADPARLLIGDDEHGWSDQGVFNFEGGCYAKCIDLTEANEPVIWHAISHGAVVENVVLHADGSPNYGDSSLTQNTRAAYPREHIKLRVPNNQGQIPHAVLFLTCDLYGVLPPVSILSKEQAAYYFLSGYTALIGSTEVGSSAGIQPTFSTCFGAPFFPRKASVYADLLLHHIEASQCQVYLVNTGWTGGPYGEGGKRFKIPTTRAVVKAIVDGKIDLKNCETLPIFNLTIPREVTGVDSQCLNPQNTWANPSQYLEYAEKLSQQFKDNFRKFTVSDRIRLAGPE